MQQIHSTQNSISNKSRDKAQPIAINIISNVLGVFIIALSLFFRYYILMLNNILYFILSPAILPLMIPLLIAFTVLLFAIVWLIYITCTNNQLTSKEFPPNRNSIPNISNIQVWKRYGL